MQCNKVNLGTNVIRIPNLGNQRHKALVKFKFRRLEVLLNPHRIPRGRNRGNTVAEHPLNENRILIDIVNARNTRQDSVQWITAGNIERCQSEESLHLYIIILQPVRIVQTASVRVELDLVDGRLKRGYFEDLFDMLALVIGDADRSGFLGRDELFHFLPGTLEVLRGFGETGAVDEEALSTGSALIRPIKSIVQAMGPTDRRNVFQAASGCDPELLRHHPCHRGPWW